MKLLFIGDIMGEAGRKMVQDFLPGVKKKHAVDVIIANGENMAGGFGITPETVQELYHAGVHMISGGNHTMDKKEGIPILEDDPYCVRPANYPATNPGRGSALLSLQNGLKVGLVNLMGRTFMDPLDCPFRAADTLVSELSQKTKVILLDFHAEATSEKMAMGWHMDGKVSVVVGTHTHVQTADERILPGGTAFITDVGMTGPYDSVIGVKKEIILDRFVNKRGRKFEVASGDPWFCAIVADIDENTGHARKIERIRIERSRPETQP
jgi:metallophosphoesterase (TIGR00282 family)